VRGIGQKAPIPSVLDSGRRRLGAVGYTEGNLLRLLVGPPGSGKTTLLLQLVAESARRGRDGVRLVVPTATMAEHLRNELARRGLLVRRRTVETLWRFLETLAGDLPEVPEATYRLLVRRALEAEGAALGEIRYFPGFQGAVADRLEQLAEAGLDAAQAAELLDSVPGKLLSAVYARLDEALHARGLHRRSERLREAAERVRREGVPGLRTIAFDGFFTFTAAELDWITALG
jgi:ATP-dependent helicase/DNAse subunit B